MDSNKPYCLFLNGKYWDQLMTTNKTFKLNSLDLISRRLICIGKRKRYYLGFYSEQEILIISSKWLFESLMIPNTYVRLKNHIQVFLNMPIKDYSGR